MLAVMHERFIDPYVPEDALKKPEGAVVDQAGLVTCVACQQSIPLAKADIVGLGYRCVPCGQKASIASLTGRGDAGAHFTSRERSRLSETGIQLAFVGVGVIALGALVLPFGLLKLGGIGIMGGISVVAVGLARRNAAKG
jgi:hypothetical protein